MRIPCDCGNGQFYLNWVPPLRLIVQCVECGSEKEVGGDMRP